MMKVRCVAALLLTVATLTACAAPGVDLPGQPTDPPTSVPATDQPSTGIDFGTANADKSVMAQVTVAAGTNPNFGDGGGTITAILRAVQVQNGTMTVRFALQWDNPAKPDSAGASARDVGLELADMLVVDNRSLTAYRPFCTDGVYPTDHLFSSASCIYTQLIWPVLHIGATGDWFKFPNHGLVEGGAILPAPQGNPATVDVALGTPLPVFTEATVTYR